MKECEKCQKEYKESGCPSCYNCMMEEHDKEVKTKLFKYPELIGALEEFGLNAEYGSGESMYEDNGQWYFEFTDTKGNNRVVEDFYPEDMLALYEVILKHQKKTIK